MKNGRYYLNRFLNKGIDFLGNGLMIFLAVLGFDFEEFKYQTVVFYIRVATSIFIVAFIFSQWFYDKTLFIFCLISLLILIFAKWLFELLEFIAKTIVSGWFFISKIFNSQEKY